MGEVTEPASRTGPLFSRPGPIQRSDDTSKFFCGKTGLDDWIRNTALKSEGRSARTYTVCVGSLVVGYYCLATGSIRRDAAPKNLSRNTPDPIPVIIIGRLAVDKHFERQGIGGGMLADAFRRIAQASETVGCGAVLVHAIDREAVEFYVRWGFLEYPGNSRTMFLPMKTLLAAL